MNNLAFRAAILIPVYNHEQAIVKTLAGVLQYQLPILLVDDGSAPTCRDVLQSLAKCFPEQVSLHRLDENIGKGGAVKVGLRKLLAEGFTHALQVDADGQHDLSDVPAFLRLGKEMPNALISGLPSYDNSVPKIRYYCRYLTHVWVWINTLSLQIKDSLCGFRLYPLVAVVKLLDEEKCGNRMDFDSEVIVRWSWRGGRVENLLTEVKYPSDGVSHFDGFHDNILISLMHARLFFGMLSRLPSLLMRKMQ